VMSESIATMDEMPHGRYCVKNSTQLFSIQVMQYILQRELTKIIIISKSIRCLLKEDIKASNN
jgi:hypothetical protein